MRTFACLALLIPALGCGRASAPSGPLRVGFLPNITHAQALVGRADGTFARDIPSGVKMVGFNAGPAAMEAILAGSLDAAYLGAGPAILGYVRSDRRVRVVAGAVSGGSVLVTRSANSAEDLVGQRVGVPQIGNTQDIAMRTWLSEHGLRAADRGGEVAVLPLANPDILNLFKRHQLEGAWVPEPWGARLIAEGGRILVDERELWPGHVNPTTVLVVSEQALETRPEDVKGLLRAHAELTRRWRENPTEFAAKANAAYGAAVGRPLPEAIAKDAFSRLTPTLDPMAPALRTTAEHAAALGYVPSTDLSKLVDFSVRGALSGS